MKLSSLRMVLYLFLLTLIQSCAKDSKEVDNTPATDTLPVSIKDICINPASIGRIIGFNPFQSFISFDTARFYRYDPSLGLGSGYVIEIDKGTMKDTVISYQMTFHNFSIHPKRDNIDYLWLFKKDYQDSLKIKFNYKSVAHNTELIPFAADGNTQFFITAWHTFIDTKKEVSLSCITKQ